MAVSAALIAAGADCGALPFEFCFDFRKSRLLQLLIQRGKIGFEQFVPRVHHRSDLCFEIRDGSLGRGCRRSIGDFDFVEQLLRRI